MNIERKAREDRKEHTGSAGAAGVAFLLYVALTMVMTWPLVRGLSHDIPGDFGDPLFTSWVLCWDATHLGRGWWSANIFAPQPLALAYSEHFLPQALQVLPIYAVTKNPILCYNLLFLSTFALAGLGMFLLGRELTGSATAGLVAGLAFAFAPYRIANIPHLQVLSSAWMPFVLFGLHRHFASGRLRPLAGAAAAWLVQNLSCGYYLLFFTPVVILYIVWELTRRRLWSDGGALLSVVTAVTIVLAATLPFLLPYVELRRLGFSPRSLTETRRFSADVYAYFTADPNLRLWGSIAQAWPKPEGLLFPGLTIVVLAAFGIGGWDEEKTGTIAGIADTTSAPRSLRSLPFFLVVGPAALVVALLLGYSIRLPGIKITSLPRVLGVCAVAGAIVLVVAREARANARRWLSSPSGIFSAITLFAFIMSLGPEIQALGRSVSTTNLYAAFYTLVPGFDGVRVPARYATIVTLGLAGLAALGMAAINRRRRAGAGLVAGALILVEALAVPMPINQNSRGYKQAGLSPLPPSIGVGVAAPEIYRFVSQLPASAVLLELPLGEPAFDVRYMFYSTLHWRRLVNGYSGGFPSSYEVLTESLKDVSTRPDRAWQAIISSAATHVIVHEDAYANGGDRRFSDLLNAHGARDIATFGSDRLFLLPPRILNP
ncbi:MAG TPA: hypothetical protein VHT95_05465 [Vicinamibacterales bacterium]|nr:hypothetical protein [Vicinamibacterales bacterium]